MRLSLSGVTVRPYARLPGFAWGFLAAALLAQLLLKTLLPAPVATANTALPPPPSPLLARLATLDDPLAASRLLLAWLQMFDNQPGISIPFRDLDYRHVTAWLDRALQLDPRSRYPLALASRVYGEVEDAGRRRLMWDWVYARFLEAPNQRWNWLAHITIMAKYRQHDLALARRYAEALRRHAGGAGVPHWARDLVFGVLEDLGELEALQILIAGQIEDGSISDLNELRFLHWKLAQLAEKYDENPTP